MLHTAQSETGLRLRLYGKRVDMTKPRLCGVLSFMDEDCIDEFRPLCSDEFGCVQCFVDEDCPAGGDICEENECLPGVQSVCGLKVRPKKLNLKALFKTGEKRFKITGIKGEAGFDPYAPISFGGEYQTHSTFVKIKNKGAFLKVTVGVSDETTIDQLPNGPLTVSVGGCTGRIMVK